MSQTPQTQQQVTAPNPKQEPPKKAPEPVKPKKPTAVKPKPPAVKPQPQAAVKSDEPAKEENANEPFKPKKGMSSFLIFCTSMRQKITQQYPGIPICQISQLLGEKWRNMTLQEKQPYVDLAAAANREDPKSNAQIKPKQPVHPLNQQ